MVPIRDLIRLGRRLQEVWQRRASGAARDRSVWLDRLADSYENIREARRRLDCVEARGLLLAAARLREDLQGRLSLHGQALSRAEAGLLQPLPVVPALAAWISELRQLEAEFGDLELKLREGYLAVQTEPLVLEDVELGPFAIRLYWHRQADFTDAGCFDVVALDPHPAATNESVTHPHVRDEAVCPGDGAEALRLALDEGRLADAFCLVASVLRHYNPRSPHVALSDWEGIACWDCEYHMSPESSTYCEGCQHEFCDECTHCCESCSNTRCHNCLTTCAVCECYTCQRCLQYVEASDKDCCRDCVDTCSQCGELVAKDDRDRDTGLCPDCQPVPIQATEVPVNTATLPSQIDCPIPSPLPSHESDGSHEPILEVAASS